MLENRLADGMALQLDTTVNYANNKGGITTSAQDRANPSPYNTYVHPGLARRDQQPGRGRIRAVLAPTPGDWLFFVGSIPTPARPGSARPPRSTSRTSCCSAVAAENLRGMRTRDADEDRGMRAIR